EILDVRRWFHELCCSRAQHCKIALIQRLPAMGPWSYRVSGFASCERWFARWTLSVERLLLISPFQPQRCATCSVVFIEFEFLTRQRRAPDQFPVTFTNAGK